MDEIERLVSLKWDEVKNSPAEYLKLQECYIKEFRTNPCCLDTLEVYWLNHRTKSKKKQMNKQTPKSENYELNPGTVIWLSSRNMHVNNASLTDELARAILEENPRRAKDFLKMPKDHLDESDIKKNKAEQGSEDVATLLKSELKERLEKLGVPEKEYMTLNKESLIALLLEKRK